MSAAPMHGIELREARFQDYPAIAALEAAQGLVSKPVEEWRRLWAGNPCYEEIGPRWPIGWVLEEGERIVGALTNIPLTYSFRGRKLIGAGGRGWVLEERYRDEAPLLMNAYFQQENVDICVVHAADSRAVEAFTQFGSWRAPVGDWSTAVFTITEYRGYAESLLRSRGVPLANLLSFPLGAGLLLKDSVMRKGIPHSDIDTSFARDFDQKFATFWEVLSQRSEALVAGRSRETLKWHFAASLEKNALWVLAAVRNLNIDAYAVFERHDDKQSGLKRMRMVDFQACDWGDQYCAALMQRAHNECRAQGIHVLEQVGCGVEKTKIFDQAAPHRRKLAGWCFFYYTRDEELAEHLAQKDAWSPSSYDAGAGL